MKLQIFFFLVLSLFLSACTHRMHVYQRPIVFEREERVATREVEPQLPIQRSIKRKMIIIDAGHGGKDLGAHSDSNICLSHLSSF